MKYEIVGSAWKYYAKQFAKYKTDIEFEWQYFYWAYARKQLETLEFLQIEPNAIRRLLNEFKRY
jgi:hypothetical protein